MIIVIWITLGLVFTLSLWWLNKTPKGIFFLSTCISFFVILVNSQTLSISLKDLFWSFMIFLVFWVVLAASLDDEMRDWDIPLLKQFEFYGLRNYSSCHGCEISFKCLNSKSFKSNDNIQEPLELLGGCFGVEERIYKWYVTESNPKFWMYKAIGIPRANIDVAVYIFGWDSHTYQPYVLRCPPRYAKKSLRECLAWNLNITSEDKVIEV